MAIYIVILVVTLIVSLATGAISPVLPKYARILGASGLWVGLIFSGLNLVRIFLGPVVGSFYDKRGRGRLLLSVSMVSYILSSLLFYIAAFYELLLLGRLMQGVASSFLYPVSSAISARVAPRGKTSTYLAGYSMVFFLGFGIGPAIGGAIADSYGMKNVFIFMLLMTFLSLVLVLIFSREPADSTPLKKTNNLRISDIFRNVVVFSVMLYRFIFATARGAFFTFFPILATARGLSLSQVGVIMTAQLVIMSLIQYPAGRFADRTGRKFMFLYLALLGTAILMPLFVQFDSFLVYLILSLVFAFVAGLGIPSALGIAADEGLKMGSTASVLSVNQSAFGLGMIVGPILSGVLFDLLGIEAVFYAGGVIALGGFVLVLLLRKRRKEFERASGIPLP